MTTPCAEHKGDPLDNDDCIGIYLAMRAAGHGAGQAAKEIGLKAIDVRKRLRSDPTLAEAIKDADHEYAERLEDKVRSLAEEGDRWALAIILKRKAPDVYGPLHEEKTQPGSVHIEIGTVNVSDLDGVQALARALAARKAPALPPAAQPHLPQDILDLEGEEV